jgi:tetratricopeptide (TPR) repeat protein
VSKWVLWILLTSLTGSPLGSIVILVVLYWTLDRFTTRVLPDPVRGFLRWQRVNHLERTLANNPNDRRARAELADIFNQQRRHQKAIELLKPIIEHPDEPTQTLYLFALASFGSKQYEQAERVLLAAKREEPDFRGGDLDLELGRVRFAKNDLQGAAESLTAFCNKRRSTIEGRVLLARVKEKAGDAAAAQKLKQEAWQEYVSSPPAHRRRDRFFAWQAKPARPIAYGAVAIVCFVMFAVFGAPRLRETIETAFPQTPAGEVMPVDYDEP